VRRGWSLLAQLGLAAPWFVSFGVSTALLIAGFAAALVARDFRYLGRLLLHAAAGFALFSALFYVWAALGKFSFAEPYVYNFLFRGGNSHGIKLGRSAILFFGYALESGVALCALFAVLTYLGLRRPDALTRPQLLLVTSVLVAFGMHAALRVDAYGFPKYILYALPLLALFVAGELWRILAAGAAPWRRAALLALVVLAVEGSARVGRGLLDPLPDLYLAGQAGFLDNVALVRKRTTPAEVILGHKDIGFYAERKFIGFWGSAARDAALLTSELDRHHVRVFATTTHDLEVATPEVRALLHRRFPRVLVATDAFQVWVAGG
jgi:hypothetical protein